MMRQHSFWLGLVLACSLTGCGGDPDGVTPHEKSLIKTADALNSEADAAKGRQYTVWQGAWLTDDKGEKMRVVRVVSVEVDGSSPDTLYKIVDHDIKASAANKAGDAWKTSPIQWAAPAVEEPK